MGDLIQTGAGVTEGWTERGERTFLAEGTALAKAPRSKAISPPLRAGERPVGGKAESRGMSLWR